MTDTVMIELDGELYELAPTLKAHQTITRQFGGYVPALRRIADLDAEVMAIVICVGAGLKTTGKDRQAVDEAIWRSGVGEAVGAISEYLSLLMNGGKRVDDDEKKDDDSGN